MICMHRYSLQDKDSLSEEKLPNKVVHFLLQRERIVAEAEMQLLQSVATKRGEALDAQNRKIEEVSHTDRLNSFIGEMSLGLICRRQ